jgi:NADPH-dependent 2,4-dienoyl-CoA reductase/sulfur reductase-like enzyme
MRNAAESAKRVVVIGGGFIGMEVAAVYAQKGIEVTMVLNDDRVFRRLFSPEMSRFFETYYSSRGVRLIKSVSVTELRGDRNVSAAVLTNGQAIECDLVVAGIGVEPVTDVVASSGLDISNGILVNEYLQTSHADIFAAGDVANYQDVLFEKRRRVEHWDNAVSQGQYCARSLMGDKSPVKHDTNFISDVLYN